MTSSPRAVRPATPRDLDTVVALRAEMFAAMGVVDRGTDWQERAHAWFADRLDDPRYKLVVVEVDGEVVSCALGAMRDAAPSPGVPNGGDVLVSNICTKPASRSQGHGRAAFDAVMGWAHASGIERAELMATQDGREMYSRAGFHVATFPAMRATLTTND